MCGRFTLGKGRQAILQHFELEEGPELAPRFNIAPTQPVAAVRLDPARQARELVLLRWGLIPAWAKEADIGARTINARSESLALKPAFRESFRRRRCIIPADGFYEWKQENGGKQPYYVHRPDGELLGLAGLWDRWRAPTGEAVESCTIVTMPASAELARIHGRMPAILAREDYGAWLDPATAPSRLAALTSAPGAGDLEAYPVSRRVNRAENEGPECRARLQLDPLTPA